jgi:hypothetical protein
VRVGHQRQSEDSIIQLPAGSEIIIAFIVLVVVVVGSLGYLAS